MDDEIAIVRIARAIRELRRVRREEFGLAIGEPAWDMLVELYYRDSTGASTTATQLKEASFVPDSAADRWLQHLEKEGFVSAHGHPTDVHTEFVELTDAGRETLERYLAQVRVVALQQSAGEERGRALEKLSPAYANFVDPTNIKGLRQPVDEPADCQV